MNLCSKATASAVLVLFLAILMSACGDKSSGTSVTSGTVVSTSSGTIATISTGTQGRQAAAISIQSASMTQGSGQTFRNLGNIGFTATTGGAPAFINSNSLKPTGTLAKVEKVSAKFARSGAAMAAARSVKLAVASASTTTVTNSCADGGTYGYFITSATATSNSVNIEFNNCHEDDSQINGLYQLSAAETVSGFTLTIVLGNATTPFTFMDYGAGYSSLIAKTSATNFTVAYTMTGTATSGTLDLLVASGTLDYHEYFTNDNYSLSFTNFDQSITVASTLSGTVVSSLAMTFTTNGRFRETWTAASVGHTVNTSFTNLQLGLGINGLTDAQTATSPYEQLTLDGLFSTTFSPASCMSGTFQFATNTPIRAALANGETYQGQLTINGATVLTFNNDGTITVKTGSADPGTLYYGRYDLADECPIAELGSDTAPVSSGLTGTAVVTSATGSNVVATITLSWDGAQGISASDMDLHMNYYATSSPTSSSTGSWYVDWHHGKPCTTPAGMEFGTNAVDTNGDGICDVGLDIDDVNGYGPEHITATRLPAGYYVISVNSYGLKGDLSADLIVSIQIGHKLFGPYTYTFTTEDGEATTAAAWFGVADMVVDSNGNVTIQAHDPSLELWHTGAFGVAAPAMRAKGVR